MTRASADAPALDVRGLTRQLHGRMVLRHVALEVPRQSLVVLAGPNGAGKSSLVRAVSGRLAVDAGTVTIDGHPAAEARRAGRLGVVPQDVALDPHLTVRENLRLWARLTGLPARQVRAAVDEGLAWAGLDERAEDEVQALSGGMRRLVNLLAGVVHRPALLLLDEPTVGLDQAARARFHALVADLRRQHVGVLLISHEIEELADRCDAVAVMNRGRILACAPPAALKDRYGSRDGEIVLTLAADPQGQHQALGAAGFAPAGPREWAIAAGVGNIHDAKRCVENLGHAVDQVRWRGPTLHNAVAALVAADRGHDR
jgi:ABC-2 type transport system ATP-binding protein